MSTPLIHSAPEITSRVSKPVTPKHIKQARDFLRNNRAAAMATVSTDGIPHVATVYCLVKDDLTLYFVTRVEARKYKNVYTHPVVAMTFINETHMKSVQLTGRAKRLDSLAQEQTILYELLTLRHKEQSWLIPPLKMYEHGATGELAVIQIKPTEMTYADFKKQPSGKYQPFFSKVM